MNYHIPTASLMDGLTNAVNHARAMPNRSQRWLNAMEKAERTMLKTGDLVSDVAPNTLVDHSAGGHGLSGGDGVPGDDLCGRPTLHALGSRPTGAGDSAEPV